MYNHNLNTNLSQYIDLFKEITSGKATWKVAIYVRLSKEDGKTVSRSIKNQIKKIAMFLRNFDDFEIYDIYIDDGLTGTDFERNDYIRLQEDIKNKIVNCMIVGDLTRYARNIADGIKELDDFVLKYKIRFISTDNPEVDTFKDPTAISSPEVYQALQNAEDFARVTSKKVRTIKAIKREDGEKNGGFPPYGYLPNPNGEHWLYDPVAGEVKKKMYLWSAEGMSDREISKKLNSLGIPNPTAYKKSIGLNYHHPKADNNSGLWWPSTVRRILEDKNNIGCSVQGKSSSFDHKRHKQVPKKKEDYIVVPDCHEKTVSDDLFDKVAKTREQRTRITKKTGKVHLFANLVYCSCCNRAMKKTGAKGKDYLVCRTYRELGKEYCSVKGTINFKNLEDILSPIIQSQIDLVIDLQSTVDKINQQPVINNQSLRINQMIENNQQLINKAEYMLDSCYYDWKNGDISKEQYQRIQSDAEKKIEQLKSILRTLLFEQQKISKGLKSNNEYFEKFLAYRNVESLDRMMLLELIDRIYINEDKTIKVEFNYDDQYLLILDFIEQNKINEEIPNILKREK